MLCLWAEAGCGGEAGQEQAEAHVQDAEYRPRSWVSLAMCCACRLRQAVEEKQGKNKLRLVTSVSRSMAIAMRRILQHAVPVG